MSHEIVETIKTSHHGLLVVTFAYHCVGLSMVHDMPCTLLKFNKANNSF